MSAKEFTFEMLQQRKGECDPSFVIWREEDLFGVRHYPVRIDFPACFVCVSGTLELEINLQPVVMKSPYVLWFSANCAVRILRRSEDFCCIGILLSRDYWKSVLLKESALGMIAVRNFFMAIGEEEKTMFFQVYELLKLYSGSEKRGKSWRQVVSHLIVGWLYMLRDVGEICMEDKRVKSRGERLFYDFLELVYRNYKECRWVGFYAERLSVTPRYLTTVVRQVSGKSASRWIEEYTVLEAQILLSDSRLSIKDIAYALHFNDQSLFSKYFKRIEGISPEKYRRMREGEVQVG